MPEVMLYNVLLNFDNSLASMHLWPCMRNASRWFHRDNCFDKIGRISRSNSNNENIGPEESAHGHIDDSCRRNPVGNLSGCIDVRSSTNCLNSLARCIFIFCREVHRGISIYCSRGYIPGRSYRMGSDHIC